MLLVTGKRGCLFDWGKRGQRGIADRFCLNPGKVGVDFFAGLLASLRQKRHRRRRRPVFQPQYSGDTLL